MKVTDSVYMLDSTSESHAYLITEPEVILVDTCLPWKGVKILEEIRSLGVDPRQIKHIMLTHHDVDHIGNAARFVKVTGATLWAFGEEIPYIMGEKPRPGHKRFIAMLIKTDRPERIVPFPLEMRVGEVSIIPAPGHTPGHVCLLYRDVLFAGDLVVTDHGKIKPSPAIMTWDMPLVLESMHKVADYPFTHVCPAHGMPVTRGDQWKSALGS